jgi:hypothetical protein
VYHAAWQYFLEHPVSLFIGFAKSYRDFFLPGERSIFPFGSYAWQNGLSVVLWVGILILLVWGFICLIKDMRSTQSALLLAGFVGVLLSIPFLPPIDGGARFHASTMSFFWLLPAFGLSQLIKRWEPNLTPGHSSSRVALTYRSASILLLVLTLIIPVGVYALPGKTAHTVPACPSGQKPFAIQIYPGSYIDLVKPGSFPCGSAPEVCLDDFEQNNIEISIDDFYQYLLRFMDSAPGNLRVVPALDMVEGRFHYFLFPVDDERDSSSFGLTLGCATQVETKNQSIYQVETIATQ